MYDEANVPGPAFRVRRVVRYVVTRYCFPYQSKDGSHGNNGGSEVIAEFPSEERAYEVAGALADAETGQREAMWKASLTLAPAGS